MKNQVRRRTNDKCGVDFLLNIAANVFGHLPEGLKI